MKKLLLIAMVAGLLFTGCSQKGIDSDADASKRGAGSGQNVDDRLNQIASVDNSLADSEARMREAAMQELQKNLQVVYFDFDKFNIKSSEQPKVKTNSSLLKEDKVSSFGIKVEGNCDEWGTDEYNYALGLKRAKSVKDSLVSEGVAESRVMVISYGESNPTCKESNKACWDKNRRVEFKILP